MSNRELASARRWFPARLLAGSTNPPAWATPTGFLFGLLACVGPTLPMLLLFARSRFRAARARRAAAAAPRGVAASAPPFAEALGAAAHRAAAAAPCPPPAPAAHAPPPAASGEAPLR